MPGQTRTITADELFRMPDDGFPYELVEGALKRMSPPGFEHAAIVARLAAVLTHHVEGNGLGIVLAGDAGFVLARGPDTVRGPDVAFVARARIAASGIPKAYWPGPPDLAVEILSPGNTRAEIDEKIADYLRAGAKEVWVADPASRTLTIHEPGAPPRVLGADDTLDGGNLLPGLRYPIARLWVRVIAAP